MSMSNHRKYFQNQNHQKENSMKFGYAEQCYTKHDLSPGSLQDPNWAKSLGRPLDKGPT